MISCQQRRESERPQTLDELAKVGLNPVVAENGCAPARGALNRLAAYQALQHAVQVRTEEDGVTRTPYADAALFCEDDIIIDENLFPRMLELAQEADEVTTFLCMRTWLHPPGVLKEKNPAPRLVELQRTKEKRGYYGTQCVYLPAWMVEKALQDRDAFMQPNGMPHGWSHGFDFWLKNNADRILMAFPNPVDHRAPPKMRRITQGNPDKSKKRGSLTFGRPTRE